MKKKIADLLKNKKIVGGCAAIALAVIIGGVSLVQRANDIPELPVYQDPLMETSIEEEETPLASKPTVTTKTTKKTSKKKVKLAKAATKTYSKKLPATKKTTSKVKTSGTEKVVTQTTVTTAKTEKYTKKSKTKVVTTTTTTTVTETTTQLAANGTTTASAKGKYEISISKIAPKADPQVISAFETLGFKIYVDSSVSYSGYFDGKARSITLKAEGDTVYHELGHFLAFIAGNVDKTSSFAGVYNGEKNSFSGSNKPYVTQNAAEYFAESYKDYVVSNSALKSSRPKTYEAVSSALGKVTTAQVTKLQKMYAILWK